MIEKTLTLSTMCGGAIEEMVNRELEKAARNILDPNTDDKATRTVTLTIELKPNADDPSDVAVRFSAKAKLASYKQVKSAFYLEHDLASDAVTIMEHSRGEIRGQMSLGDYVEQPDVYVDSETGEVIEQKIIDLRRRQA